MEWIAWSRGSKIQHAGNGREKKFVLHDNSTTTTIKVDGYIEETDTALEFLGWYQQIFIKK
jgi:hypothetical protein